MEPVWVDRLVVDAIHFDQIQQHGGPAGVRDENAIEAALARPRNRRAYEPPSDLADLAAAHGYALARSHGYADGNKRVAFAVMYTFLGLNGWEIDAPEPAVVRLMIDVAAGRCQDRALAVWLCEHVSPLAD